MPRYLVYAEGQLGTPAATPAPASLRSPGSQCAAVLDSRFAGQRVQDVLGFGGDIPVVGSVREGAALGADALVVGIAMHGAGFPGELTAAIREAIDRRLEIWNG